MWKKVISYIAAAVSIIAAFIFGRAINRQRISRDNDSIERIRDGIAESGKVNNDITKRVDELEKRVDTAAKIADDITADNRTAIRKLATARELLERAKARTDNNKNP